jgi:hypothetical protein
MVYNTVTMKRILLLAVGLGAACGRGEPAQDVVMDSLAAAGDYFPADSADSVLSQPRLVTEPTVILFWLAAGDTLRPDDAAAIQDDLNYYTERIISTLSLHGIRLYPTNSDTVYVAMPNNQRRAIVLTGLEYPFGYVLIEPEDVERTLTGVYDDEALLDEIGAYFDITGDTTAVAPKITT